MIASQPIGGKPRTWWTRHKVKWGYKFICHGTDLDIMVRGKELRDKIMSKPWGGWAGGASNLADKTVDVPR